MTASIQSVPLGALHLSDTGAQAERRKRFDKAAIGELAESIKTVGLLNPLVVCARFHKDGGSDGFAIVAGERRFLAAKAAGLTEIPVSVRELTREQILEVQLIENLQREGLHELVEAEGYEALMKQHGHTVDDLVAKVGKSKGYVYARLKLLALGPAGRQMFFDGKLSASTALLVARIPDAALQRKACGEVINGVGYDRGPMSYRDAADHIHRHYMLKLSEAGFPTSDADLVAAAGACGTCPKRTGNQPELFGDVKGGDVCTDPPCFQKKRDAYAKRQVEEARTTGRTVIEGKQAQAIAPHGLTNLARGYVRLDDRCWEDAKNRTYRQLLGKEAQPALLVAVDRKGEAPQVVEIVEKSAVAGVLKSKGVKSDRGNDDYRGRERAQEKKTKAEQLYRLELVRRLQMARAKKRGEEAFALDLKELQVVAHAFFDRLDNDAQMRIAKVWNVEPKKGKSGYGRTIELPLKTPNDAAALILDCVYAMDLHVSNYSTGKPDRLLEACKRYGVDAEAVKRDLAAAERPRKPAKKK